MSGLNPSNIGAGFPSIGDAPFTNAGRKIAEAEMRAVGISPTHTSKTVEVLKPGSQAAAMAASGIWMPSMKNAPTERIEVYRVEAKAYGWRFSRAWYYWVCESVGYKPIPEHVARKLNEIWRDKIRVNGYAGGTDVTGPVSAYHVDGPEALAALVEVLREL